jgi:hypothetical protein
LSRRKDRERILAIRRGNPDYTGFRGYDQEPSKTGDAPMATAVCSECGRKRNVPVGIVLEQGEAFVCLSCQQKAEEEPSEDESQPEGEAETAAPTPEGS